ncbi:hypothetical protein OESDEN_09630 [Oesophagostomum dentatum]|uniref:Kunitz/Bovine pancreatic trypsin inhibitor domain protein n=1 Tax=Oesophagostomum dentatum TaxID=61180 RepID=A0A0B1T2Z4_OESDE|nr:hypothetical protein OESDEN_09630 [Oesophagostomum dentatum]
MFALHNLVVVVVPLLFLISVQAQYPPWISPWYAPPPRPWAGPYHRHNGNQDCLNAPLSTEDGRFRDCKLHRGYTQMKYGYVYNPYDDDCKYRGYDECQIPPRNFFPSFYDCQRACLRY